MIAQDAKIEPALTDLLFEKAGVGLCLVAPDGTIVRANSEWLRSMGFTSAQVIGEDLLALFPDARDLGAAMHARARAGDTFSVPPHQVTVQGRSTWWEGSISPVPMENGVGLLITARDVTEQVAREASDVTARQRAERGLEAAERQLRALVDSNVIGIVTADVSGRITSANDYFLRLLGLSREELDGGSLRWDTLTPPKWAEDDRRAVEQIRATGRAGPFEKEYLGTDGARVPVLLGATRIGDSAETITYVLDLTPQKRVERELREAKGRLEATLAHAPLVLFEQDATLRYTWVHNPVPSLGRAADEIIGRRDAELFERSEDAAVTERLKREVLATGRAQRAEVVLYARGEERVYDLAVEPKRAANGTVEGVTCVAIDVTSQRGAMTRLRDSEALLRLALRCAGAGVFEWDPLEDRIRWSPENYELFGVEDAGRPLRLVDFEALIHPQDRAEVAARARELLERDPDHDRAQDGLTEFRVNHPRRGIRWILSVGRVQCDALGRPVRMLGLNLDVTERHEGVARLADQGARLRLALEASQTGIWTWDIGTDAVGWSPEAYAICGLAEGGFEETGSAFFRMVHEDDRARVEETLRAALANRTRYRCEFRILRPDGTEIWVENLGMATYGADGAPVRVLGTVADVSERKRALDALRDSERRLRELADAMPQLVWIADADGRIRYFNARLELYGEAGYLPDGRSAWQPLIYPEDLAATEERWQQAVAARSPYACEHRVRMADGSYRWHVTRANPVEERGGVLVWYGTTTDIHDRVEDHQTAQREREARLAEMENRVQLGEMFVGILGHDLRDPLSTISMSGSLLKAQANSPGVHTAAQRIATSADRMRRMITQLLDVTRARLGGGLSLDPVPLDLAALLRRVVEETETAHRRVVQVDVAGDPGGTWDRNLLEQLVSNLTSNACQHGHADAPVGVRLDGTSQDLVHLEVRNAGAIPAEILPTLFDPFRRGTRGARRTGLGLGLYIAREIAVAHGGEIGVESSEEAGTRFTVQLPRTVRQPGRAFVRGESERDSKTPAGQLEPEEPRAIEA